jgi:D-serine deaminase-like pyridoxal phosphate-dependent protein
MSETWNNVDYRLRGLAEVMTPALVIYPEIVRTNIENTLRVLGGNPNFWRPHVKTAKLTAVMRMLIEYGVTQLKCATTLELTSACRSGATDVLVAYGMAGANAARVREIAREFPRARISTLVEAPEQIGNWKGTRVGLFVDINPGMDRTGIEQSQVEQIFALVTAIRQSDLEFRGLHYYDGHLRTAELQQRIIEAHLGYDQLLKIVKRLESEGIAVSEVITSGTPTFPAALVYAGFRNSSFLHRASPGTVVYGDTTSADLLPKDYHYCPAALVLSRVVSHPRPGIITCDAGLKTLSVDAGVPNCTVVGAPEFRPLRPSEEHLPIQVPLGGTIPMVGEILYLVPRHVCPTVNNFDYGLFARNGRVESIEPVSARGREAPIVEKSDGVSFG